MPVQWQTEFEEAPASPGASARGTPLARVLAWPHQSMTPEGFVGFMAATLALVALPLLTVLGSPVLWGLLPFIAVVIWGLWLAISRNRRDGRLTETLTLWSDRIELVRREPQGRERHWDANPFWVSVSLHSHEGPVEKYLTLKGASREVEFGAFLSPDERVELHTNLCRTLSELRAATPRRDQGDRP